MADSETRNSATGMRNLLLVVSICTILVACLELTGWISGWQPHAGTALRSIPMAPSTAICFILLALIGLFEPQKASGKAHVVVLMSVILFVVVFCGLDLLESLGATSLDLEDLLLPESGFLDAVPLGRMSPVTATLLVLSAGSILLSAIRSMEGQGHRPFGHLSGLLGCVVTFSGFTIVLAYLYQTPLLYNSGFIPVAATTALGFVFLGLAVFARLRSDDIPKRYFRGSAVHRQLSQTFVPLVFFAVLLQGILSRFAPLLVDINNALLSAVLAGIVAVLAAIVTSKAISSVGDAIVRAEEALRVSEKRKRFLAAVLEQAPQPFAVAYTDGHLGIVNHAFCHLTGYDESELSRTDWIEHLTPPECREGEKRALEELVRAGTPVRYEKEYIRKDGRRIPVELLVHVVREEKSQVPCYCLFATDLTERKQAQEALNRASREWDRTFNSFSDLIMVLDRQHKIVRANKSMADAFNVGMQDVIGKSCFDLVHGEQEPPSFCPHSKLLSEGGEHAVEVFEPCLGGTYEVRVSPFRDEEERVVGSVHIIRDISARKQMEESLKQSESTLRGVLRSAPVGIGLVINRIFKWTNDFLSQMTGYSEEDLLGQSARLLYESDEEFERVGMMIRHPEIGNMGTITLETNWRRKDDSLIETILSLAAVNPQDLSEGIVFSALDVTNRKRAEREARESEERYRAVFENAGIGINVVNRDGKLSHANAAFLNMLGYSEAQLRQFTPPDITHPEDRELTKQYMDGIIGGEFDSFSLEKRYIQKNGSVIWGHLSVSTIRDAEGKPTAAVGVIADITGRKRAEEELVQAKHDWEETFNSITDAITVHDKDFNIIRGNKAAEKMLGLPDSLIPKECKCYRYYHGKNAPPGECPSCNCLETREQAIFEVFEPHLNRHIEIRAIPRLDNNGQLTGLIHVVRDITDKKRAEEEKANLEQQLRQSQKMEAIGTLSGGIAHDFNNLLTVILGYSELIISEKDKKDRDYEDLKKVIYAARTAADMVQQILAFSRKTETRLRPLNLNRHVEQLRKMLSRLIPRTIEVRINLDSDLPTVNADHAQIDQILMNLAVNARDAMQDGGKLTIETRLIFLDDEYCRSHVEASGGAHVRLTVGDTGIGIDKASIDRIFEPFYTTKKPGEGTGLGLAMVYGIVKSHGGHVTCQSEPGVGTVFIIYLPVHQVGSEVDVETSQVFSAIGTETILLVDDEEFVRDLGKRLLEKSGYNVVTASDGREAFEIYRAQGKRISLVILDLIMPVMDGKQCLERLLTFDSTVKVVIASGYSGSGQTGEALSAGAMGFVNKPYDTRQVLEVIRTVLDG